MINFQMSLKEILAFLFVIGIMLFNWPLLSIFDVSLPYYLFGMWFLLIGVTGITVAVFKKRNTE